jgi:hypothetical protein
MRKWQIFALKLLIYVFISRLINDSVLTINVNCRRTVCEYSYERQILKD